MKDFTLPPMDIRDHAAEVAVICAGCGCSLCYGQQFRSLYLQSIGIQLICHNKRQCLIDAAKRITSKIGQIEAMAQVRYLITEEQREKAHLS